MRDALACQLIERAVQLDRIGRGQRAVFFAPGRNETDGADAGGLSTERAPDLPREGDDRGLAAGAGDRCDGAGLTREEFRRRQRQRPPRVLDLNEGDARGQSRRRLFGRDRDGACRDGLLGEMRAVGFGAGDGEKQKTRFDLAAVGGNTGDIERREARVERDIPIKIGKPHPSRTPIRHPEVRAKRASKDERPKPSKHWPSPTELGFTRVRNINTQVG